jgi:pimeloyl-ACP methyl ester carboxylesterase
MKTEQKISIVEIHGNGGGGFRFDIAKPLFPSNVNFFNPTLPGFNSTKKHSIDLTMKQYADWLARYLKDIEPPVILMGHGLGGVFVLEFLQHYPEMVDGVILHSIVGANLNKRVFPKIMKLPLVAWLTKNIIAHPITRPIISRKFFQRKIDKSYEKKFFDAFAACQPFERMFHLIDYSWFKYLKTIPVPTIFLWGEKDWILTPREINALQKLFPLNYKDIVPDWDHFPMIDRPEGYALKVTESAKKLLEHSYVFN